MKPIRLATPFLLLISLPFQATGQSSGPQGDMVFWIPFKPGASKRAAQIPRNSQYVSIKIHSVHAYYRSGFFENIKNITVISEISLMEGGRVMEGLDGTMVNGVFEKSRNADDFVGLNSHLAVLSPAVPDQVKMRIRFSGIGEDRFKGLFDLLSGEDVKSPLGLSQAAMGRVGGITAIVKGLLKSPYTSDRPKQMLDVTQSFVLYADNTKEYEDALREGYVVIVSAREKKTDDLARIQSLGPEDLRVEGQKLMFRDTQGQMRPLLFNSYVILTVTQTPVRGENQRSTWFRKYSDAIKASEKIREGEALEKVKKEALALWKEGNTLLESDATYLDSERRLLRAAKWNEIEKNLKDSLKAAGVTPIPSLLSFDDPAVPRRPEQTAKEYASLLESHLGGVRVDVDSVLNWSGNSYELSLINASGGAEYSPTVLRTLEGAVSYRFQHILPGDYVLQLRLSGHPVNHHFLRVEQGKGARLEIKPETVAGAGFVFRPIA